MDDSIRLELENRPERLSDLSRQMGDTWSVRFEILECYNRGEIKLQQIPTFTMLNFSLVFLIIIELLPPTFRGIPALIFISVFPLYWTRVVLFSIGIDRYFAIPLVVSEIILIGFILGFGFVLTPTSISIALGISMLVKYSLSNYFSRSNPG